MSSDAPQRKAAAGEPAGDRGMIVQAAPLLVSVPKASRMLGLSSASVKRMMRAGELPSVLAGPGGGRRLLATADLAAYVAGLHRQHGTTSGSKALEGTAPHRGKAHGIGGGR